MKMIAKGRLMKMSMVLILERSALILLRNQIRSRRTRILRVNLSQRVSQRVNQMMIVMMNQKKKMIEDLLMKI